jgi:hypothetical protein
MTYLIHQPSQTKTVPDSFVAQTVKKQGTSLEQIQIELADVTPDRGNAIADQVKLEKTLASISLARENTL